MQCELMLFDTNHLPYLRSLLTEFFSNSFTDFDSFKVSSSRDMKMNEA